MYWSNVHLDDDTTRPAQTDPSIAPEANPLSSVSLDSIASIDEAVKSTIAEMPNALRLLENS